MPIMYRIGWLDCCKATKIPFLALREEQKEYRTEITLLLDICDYSPKEMGHSSCADRQAAKIYCS